MSARGRNTPTHARATRRAAKRTIRKHHNAGPKLRARMTNRGKVTKSDASAPALRKVKVMPERSRFKEAREKIAHRWAKRSIAALASVTREMGQRWSSECYETPRDALLYVPYEYPALEGPRVTDPLLVLDDEHKGMSRRDVVTTPTFTQEETDATSLRTLYPQLAEHPAHSRMRQQVIDGRAEHWPELAHQLAEAEAWSAIHRWMFPTAYGDEEYVAREQNASTDAVVMSTTYQKVVNWVPRIHLAPIVLLERVVTYKVADDPMTDYLRRGRPTRSMMSLERAADAFLRSVDPCVGQHDTAVDEHYVATIGALLNGKPEDVPNRPRLIRLDVLDRNTRQPTTAPDRAAFRGVVRRKLPAPMRYTTRPVWEDSDDAIHAWAMDVAPITTVRYRTDRVGTKETHRVVYGADGLTVPTAEASNPHAGAWREKVTIRTTSQRHDFAWVGHGKIATGEKVRMTKKLTKRKVATKIKRGDAIGKRGIARNGWSYSDRSLTRAWSKADAGQHAVASLIVRQLVAFATSPLAGRTDVTHLSDTLAVATDGVYAWRIGEHGPSRSYTLQAFARRAALSREDVS